MTEPQIRTLEISAVVLVAAVILWALRNGGAGTAAGVNSDAAAATPSVQQVQATGPNYLLSYNVPPDLPGVVGSIDTPVSVSGQSSTGPAPTCGCGSVDLTAYPSFASLVDSLDNIGSDYLKQVTANLPPAVFQFVGNTQTQDAGGGWQSLLKFGGA